MVFLEVLTAGISIIVCSSLALVNALDKRSRRERKKEIKKIECEVKEELELASFEYDDTIKIFPYLLVVLGTKCPKCERPSKNNSNNTECIEGVVPPISCDNFKRCPVGNRSHLHMSCLTCGSKWYMKPKDST
jgi:hypothetical protein